MELLHQATIPKVVKVIFSPCLNPAKQPTYYVSAQTNFSASSAPGYTYVVDSGTNTLEVLAPGTDGALGALTTITVGNDPSQVAVSPDGLTAFVTNTGDGTISIIDTETLSVINLNPDHRYGQGDV